MAATIMVLFKSSTVRIEKDQDGSVMVILDSKDDPVNRVTLSLIRDLQAGVDFLQKSTAPPVIIFRSGKSNGFALGPDLQEWKEFHASGGYAEWQKEGMRLVETISKLPCPTIAAIHGPCMGPGFEIALACDYRLAYARPDTVFSFPENEMGACPSWGMIFKLVKKAGLEASVKLVAFGEKWKPAQLARFGLLDGIATNEQQLRSEFTRLTGLALLHGKGTTGSKKHRSLRRTILEGNRLSRYLLRRVFERFLKRTGCEENTTQASTLKLLANLCAIEDLTNALELISSHAIRLFESDICQNLLKFMIADLEHMPSPDGQALLPQRVALIGHGKGLAEWAFLHLSRSVPSSLISPSHSTLGATLVGIELLLREMVRKGFWSPAEAQSRLAQLEGSEKTQLPPNIDMAFLFSKASRDLEPGAFGETNPNRLVISNGESKMHCQALLFQQLPLGRYPCAELSFPSGTSTDQKDRVRSWLGKLGRTCVETGPSRESLATQVFFEGFLESLLLLASKVPLLQMEKSLRSWGFTAGPLYWADWFGMDNLLELGQQKGISTSILDLFQQMAKRGWNGIDSGKGWFLHLKNSWVPNNLAANLTAQFVTTPKDPIWESMSKSNRLREGRERILLRMLLEISRLRALNNHLDPKDWDYLMVRGLGWPAFTGGPSAWVQKRGLEYWQSLANNLGNRLGPAYQLGKSWDFWFE